MTVAYKGSPPSISIDSQMVNDFRNFFGLGKEKVTLFLIASLHDKEFIVSDWYMPEQHASQYSNAVEAHELSQLGEKYGDTGDYVYGIIRGGTDVKAQFEKADYEFLDNVFFGVKKFFAINLAEDGKMVALSAIGNVIFNGIDIDTRGEPYDKETEELCNGIRTGCILTDYKVGYNVQSTRAPYIASALLDEKRDWKGVV